MHPYKRSIRVSDLIRKEIAEIIMHKLRDPRVGFVTVTGVDVSDDLRNAMVYVSVLEEARQDEVIKTLNASAKFIRGELAHGVRIKFIPRLIFKIDKSIEYGIKIDKILNEIKSQATQDESETEDGS
ncbi:MAG: 30S ribosome-binding factor RbfA [Nitrospirae bacterium]|nr:30S ribosome-binding factor RbfA [Nitrospirota bacterium]